MMMLCHFYLFLLAMRACLLSLANAEQGVIATAEFSQNGVSGTITFYQDNDSASTVINVNLLGLDQFSDSFPWHIHEYPFILSSPWPCSASSVGGHYDPLGANNASNYTELCASDRSLCEVGDLSGKFGNISGQNSSASHIDSTISLSGIYSIIGRSVVIHRQDGSRFICANIGYPPHSVDTFSTILYTPFRASVSGNMYFRQYEENMTSVYVSTLLLNGDTVPSLSHNWHVHESPIQTGNDTCASAGGHYNPRAVNISADYNQVCGPSTPLQCEVGDLSSKGGQIDFTEEQSGRLFYTDTDLPISPSQDNLSIANLSVVVHQANGGAPRLSCANLTPLSGREAIAMFFGERGISGNITFSQRTPFDKTTVTVYLTGLSSQAGGYHVHSTPIGTGDNRCSEQFTGGHWNPHNITYSVPVVNGTDDQYEIGDLSGKFGSLSNLNTTFMTYVDQNLPLFGANSVIGRSVVIHNDKNGSRLTCANIVYAGSVNEASAAFSVAGQTLQIIFQQPANDPFADTTIFVSNIVAPQLPVATKSLSPSLTLTSIEPSQTLVSTSEKSLSLLSPYLIQPSPSSLVWSTMTITETPVDGSGATTNMGKRDTEEDQALLSELLLPLDMKSEEEEKMLKDRQVAMVFTQRIKRQDVSPFSIDWSVQLAPPNNSSLTDCEALQLFLPLAQQSSSLCGIEQPLACAAGDLSAKHEALDVSALGEIRVVLTDPYLPLSGPQSIIGNVLLLQPMAGSEPPQYAVIVAGVSTQPSAATCSQIPISSSTSPQTSSSSSPPLPSSSPSSHSPTPTDTGFTVPFGLPIFIAICVGGLVLVLVILLLIILMACCCRRMCKRQSSDKYVLKDHMYKNTAVELGNMKPVDPVFGVATYRVLYNFVAQQDGDLELFIGDMVILLEAPAGGEWWKGIARKTEGWFPKSYVEFVDIEAEEKQKKEANFDKAAAAIKAASISFRHSAKPTTPTISRRDIDSTPVMVTKFENPDREILEAEFINQSGKNSPLLKNSRPVTPLLSNSRPVTPLLSNSRPVTPLLKNSRPATPLLSGQVSLSDTVHGVGTPEPTTPLSPDCDKYIAKFNYVPTTETELALTKGQLVTVLEKADNSWWHGLIEDNPEKHGWFPESFVEPYQPVPKPSMAQVPCRMSEFTADSSDEVEATEYRAVHEFRKDDGSDLWFSEGDTILVYFADDSGWWFGAAGDAQGWFPGSFVEPVIDISGAASLVSSPATMHDVEPNEDKAEKVEESKRQPAAEGWLGAEITKALQAREGNKTEDTLPHTVTSPAMEASPTAATSTVSTSLATELAAVLGKQVASHKKQLPGVGDTAISTPPSQPKTSISDGFESEILAVLNHKDTAPKATQDEVVTSEDFLPAQPTPVETTEKIIPRRRAPPPPKSKLQPAHPSPLQQVKRATPLTSSSQSTESKSGPSLSEILNPSSTPSSNPGKQGTSNTLSSSKTENPSSRKLSHNSSSLHTAGHQLPLSKPQAGISSSRGRRPPPPQPPVTQKKSTIMSVTETDTTKQQLEHRKISQPPPVLKVLATNKEPSQRLPHKLETDTRSQLKARAQKVKRPTRNIPPPPNIPLPPPPVRALPLQKPVENQPDAHPAMVVKETTLRQSATTQQIGTQGVEQEHKVTAPTLSPTPKPTLAASGPISKVVPSTTESQQNGQEEEVGVEPKPQGTTTKPMSLDNDAEPQDKATKSKPVTIESETKVTAILHDSLLQSQTISMPGRSTVESTQRDDILESKPALEQMQSANESQLMPDTNTKPALKPKPAVKPKPALKPKPAPKPKPTVKPKPAVLPKPNARVSTNLEHSDLFSPVTPSPMTPSTMTSSPMTSSPMTPSPMTTPTDLAQQLVSTNQVRRTKPKPPVRVSSISSSSTPPVSPSPVGQGGTSRGLDNSDYVKPLRPPTPKSKVAEEKSSSSEDTTHEYQPLILETQDSSSPEYTIPHATDVTRVDGATIIAAAVDKQKSKSSNIPSKPSRPPMTGRRLSDQKSFDNTKETFQVGEKKRVLSTSSLPKAHKVSTESDSPAQPFADLSLEDSKHSKHPPSRPPPPKFSSTEKETAHKEPPTRPAPPKFKQPASAGEEQTAPVAKARRKATASPNHSVSLNPSSDGSAGSTQFYKAIVTHTAVKSGHLSFKAGDILVAIDKETNQDGLVHGMLDNGTSGLFSLDHVQEFSS